MRNYTGIQSTPIDMNRFIDYWQMYGLHFDEQLRREIGTAARIYRVMRKELIAGFPMRPRWFFVLSGSMVGEYTIENSRIKCFLLPFQSFSNTAHLYTRRSADLCFTTLRACELFSMDNATLLRLKKTHPTVSDLLHILKQRQIDQLNLHIEMLQQADAYARFCFLQDKMAELCDQVPNEYLQRFLGISNGTFYTYKHRYLLEKLRKN